MAKNKIKESPETKINKMAAVQAKIIVVTMIKTIKIIIAKLIIVVIIVIAVTKVKIIMKMVKPQK